MATTIFVPLSVARPPRVTPIALTSEAAQWTSLPSLASRRFSDPVTHLTFSPVSPYDVAVAHGLAVSLVVPQGGGTIRKSFTRFRDTVYSPSYKHDGKLLVVGTADGAAKLFDVTSRVPLRLFVGHEAAVKTTCFTHDGLNVMTGSDDNTLRLWDIATSTCLHTLRDATDYVVCQSPSPVSRHVWLAGSADRTARLYDMRTRRVLFSLQHSAPIDAVAILPGGMRAVTAGGSEVRMWDFLTGGSVVGSLSCHAKAVTDVAVDSVSGRLLTGGLDGYVKVHDLATLHTQGVVPMKKQVLSVAVSVDGRRLGVGMADGCVEVRAAPGVDGRKNLEGLENVVRQPREFEGWGRGIERVGEEEERLLPKAGTRRYFERGPDAEPKETDVVVERPNAPKLKKVDRQLKKMRHGTALDAAVASGNGPLLMAVVEELLNRGVLVSALRGKQVSELCPLLRMLRSLLLKGEFQKEVILLVHTVLDIFANEFDGRCPDASRLMKRVLGAVRKEVETCRNLQVLQSSAEMLMWAPNVSVNANTVN